MDNIRVYEIDLNYYDGKIEVGEMTDRQFTNEAERQDNCNTEFGGVWSLKRYEEALNDEQYPTNSIIRFLNKNSWSE